MVSRLRFTVALSFVLFGAAVFLPGRSLAREASAFGRCDVDCTLCCCYADGFGCECYCDTGGMCHCGCLL